MDRKNQIRVVGGSVLLCEGLIRILKENPEVEVADVDHGLEPVLTELLDRPPDILLLCCSLSCLPHRSFTLLSVSFRDICAKTKVLLVADEWDECFALWALKSGVKGLLIKERTDAATLLRAIRSIVSGESWFDEHAVSSVVEHIRGGGRTVSGLMKRAVLTRQELNVLSLVRSGFSNKRIARELFVSELTVKSHLHRIFRKLGVMNRMQLVLRRPDEPAFRETNLNSS